MPKKHFKRINKSLYPSIDEVIAKVCYLKYVRMPVFEHKVIYFD